jgi:hypothetical protein
MNGFLFEIIAKAKVPEHFKESVVIGCASNVIDIPCAEAFLARCGPSEFQFHFAQKMILELIHSSWGEEYRWIPSWNENVARLTTVTLGLEEGEVFLA